MRWFSARCSLEAKKASLVKDAEPHSLHLRFVSEKNIFSQLLMIYMAKKEFKEYGNNWGEKRYVFPRQIIFCITFVIFDPLTLLSLRAQLPIVVDTRIVSWSPSRLEENSPVWRGWRWLCSWLLDSLLTPPDFFRNRVIFLCVQRNSPLHSSLSEQCTNRGMPDQEWWKDALFFCQYLKNYLLT